MPTFEITAPDGRTFEVTTPEGVTQEQAMAQISGAVEPPESNLMGAGAAGASRGILGTLDIIPRGIAGALNVALGTDLNVAPFQRLGAGLGLGTYQPQTRGEERAAFAGEMVGASAMPGGAVVRGAAAPARALATELTALGGSIGGGLVGEEMAGDPGRIAGLMAGSLAPFAAPHLARRFVGPGGAAQMQERLGASARQDVPITAGQAMGGSLLEKSAATMAGGQRAATTFAEEQAEAFAKRVDELAKGMTPKELSPESAGRAMSRGINEWTARFKQHGEDLYGLVERYMPPDDPITLARTKAVSDATIADERFSQILDAPLLRQISGALSESADVTMRDAKAIRTAVGERLASPTLVADASKGQLKRLYAALSDDLEDAATIAGHDAERVFSMANRYWKAGMQRIDDFLQPLAKKNMPEDVFKAAMAGTKEGATRIRTIKKSLNPEQWDVLVGTVLRRLGRARPSERTAGMIAEEGMDFSPETFLTNLQQLDKGARKVLFSGERYRGLEQNLDDLMAVAQGVRAQRQMAYNPSGTAAAAANIMPSVLPFMNPLQAARGAAGMVGSGLAHRAMQSPAFSGYLASPTPMAPSLLPILTRGAVETQ